MSSQRKLFAATVAALAVSFIAGWAVSNTQAARIDATPMVQIDPFKAMMSAKLLPTEHFTDYSFVFAD
jgi:hypothetical protein